MQIALQVVLFPSRNVLPTNQIEMSYMDISKSGLNASRE
ncbi:hypothetical protein P253_02793 [Acinetobacter indicus CIP 110367]|uniref:Uncharacterized protein n=1 Tax=Acinetobacter indicus CIP 110367 TaxID=1341679 RepID=V2VH09_9GAMM|nr:hypothetical protein F956_01138 [Acinetobacter indicus ANC 4215]ESK46784.1 hypothetical protein P253_02793 [Acinetobacter indicus CIP 110367]